MHCISVVGINAISGAVVVVVASIFDKLAFSMDFALFIEVPVAITNSFAVSVAIAAINVTDVTDVAAIATISAALDDFTLALAFFQRLYCCYWSCCWS